jgi:TolB-like protein
MLIYLSGSQLKEKSLKIQCQFVEALIKHRRNEQPCPYIIINKSIAVLPFVNMSADPENEYFSDGITEEIINALTTVKGLKVIARTSSFAFKNKNIDVRTIGAS